MSELKPCPFCGGKAELISDDTTTYGYPTPNWAVRCVNETCIANDITPNYSQHEDAVEDWNRRAQPANVPLTLDELRQMDGEPVYIVGRHYSGWTVPWRNAAKYIARCPDEANISYYPKDYGKTWLAYRAKPEGSEGNEL